MGKDCLLWRFRNAGVHLVFLYLLCFAFVYIVLDLLICRVSVGNFPGIMIL